MAANDPKTEGRTGSDRAITSGMEWPRMAGGTAMQAWLEFGAEAIRFVSDRLQQDIKTQQAMLACTSLAEMQKVQAEFFNAARDQYAAEARRMMEIMGKAATTGRFPAAASSKLGYDDVPL